MQLSPGGTKNDDAILSLSLLAGHDHENGRRAGEKEKKRQGH